MNYLAICTAVHNDTNFITQRSVIPADTNEPAYLLSSFAMEFGLDEEDIDSILIVKNGEGTNSPVIIRQWSKANGDL